MKDGLVQYRVSHLLIATVVVAAILAAGIACRTTYETHGAVLSVFIPLLLGTFVVVCLPFLAFRRTRNSACIALIVVCGAFSFRQAMLVRRLEKLKSEVSHIIDYMTEFESRNHAYPRNLSRYTFRHPEIKPYVDYNDAKYAPYAIRFHPTKYRRVCHWYYPDHGYYFEDD